MKPLSVGDHFVCVQSVTVDAQGFLWVVDPAAPGNEFNLEPGGPKLVKIDLSGDKVVQVIRFDRTVVPQGSYLNDVRVSPDGRTGYMTDSGVRGALIAVDLRSGRAQPGAGRRSRAPRSTRASRCRWRTASRCKRPDNRGPVFAADGIALDPEGEYLYWQALAGNTLYRIPAKRAADAAAKAPAAARVSAWSHDLRGGRAAGWTRRAATVHDQPGGQQRECAASRTARCPSVVQGRPAALARQHGGGRRTGRST